MTVSRRTFVEASSLALAAMAMPRRAFAIAQSYRRAYSHRRHRLRGPWIGRGAQTPSTPATTSSITALA